VVVATVNPDLPEGDLAPAAIRVEFL